MTSLSAKLISLVSDDRRVRLRCVICFGLGVSIAAMFFDGYHQFREWQSRELRESRSPLTNIISKRQEVPLETVKKNGVLVALVFGEANAGNEGESPRVSGEDVYSFYRGKLYHAEDPLLGGGGENRGFGSVWTRLGDLLIKEQRYQQVVLVPIAMVGSTIAQWKTGGEIHRELLARIREAKAGGLTFTHLLWHQGEADARRATSTAEYKRMFHEMLASIRQEGVTAPIYVAVATRCDFQRPTSQIQEAQRELADPARQIFAGPNTDALGFGYRYDGCHFSEEGLQAVAGLWRIALTQSTASAEF